MTDDCIVRKLFADGDGAGDDRRYAALLKNIFSLTRECDAAQAENAAVRIKATIDSADIAIKKQVLVAAMNERQIEEYKRLALEIDKLIEESAEKMQEAKKELGIARGVRRNKEQYELLAGMIQQIPSREETNSKLNALKEELEELHEKQRKLEAKLAERRNYLHSFSIILANFNKFLAEEERETANEEQMEGLGDDFIGPKAVP